MNLKNIFNKFLHTQLSNIKNFILEYQVIVLSA